MQNKFLFGYIYQSATRKDFVEVTWSISIEKFIWINKI